MAEKSIEAEYNKYKDDTPVTMECQNTGDSPCDGCKNKNGNKDICSEHCERLSAFQYNREYRHLPYYQKSLSTPQMASPLPETPKTVKPATQETSWKRAMSIKQKKPVMAQKPKPTIPAPMTYGEKLKIIADTDKCLACGRPKSEYPLRRGLCLARCSGAWRDGRIEHCLLGKWSKMDRKEINNTRYGKHEKCLMPNCHEIGNRRGLCQRHYRKWIGGSIEHPEFGAFFRKSEGKKEEVERVEDQVTYQVNVQTKDEVPVKGTIVTLNFADYQAIYSELRKQAELSSLPLSHVIFNLLSFGLISVHEEEKRRVKDAIHK